MRLFAIALLGGLLSFALGYALITAVSVMAPCVDSQSACRLGDLIGYGAVSIYGPLAALVLGLVAWRAGNERAISLAALALLAPIGGVLLFGILTVGIPTDPARDGPDMLRGFTAPTLIVIVQWAILRAYVMRRVPG